MPKQILLIFAISLNAFGFNSPGGTEARLRFQHFVDIPYEELEDYEISEKVEEQLLHMFGPMAYRPADKPAMAAPKSSPTYEESFTILSEESIGENQLRVRYLYDDTVVIQHGPQKYYYIALPRTPTWLFKKTSTKFEKDPCTDETYFGWGDYWYFWSPYRENCNFLIPGVDYDVVEAEIVERYPNTKISYPEYDRLADENGKISIYLLMGLDEVNKNRNPLETINDDENAPNYRGVRAELLNLGFEARRWTNAEIRTVVKEDTRPLPFVESLIKRFPNNERANEIEVVMFFGRTGVDQSSKGFHYFLRKAIRDGSVLIYDGHSDLGGTLHLKDIESKRTKTSGQAFRFEAPKDRYQIFYFNSCSSYTYYNSLFFDQKKGPSDSEGTKNLDIITAALETPFDGGGQTNMELIRTIHNWVWRKYTKKYQSLIPQLENDNLTAINGDEDNPGTEW